MGSEVTGAGPRAEHAGAPVLGARHASTQRTGGRPVADLITRLRETAGRMVPYSEARMLLREAAAVIERLDADLQRGSTGTA